MVAIPLLLNVYADLAALAILVYIVGVLALADRNYVKASIMLQYEAMKRDKVFRKALVVLAFSITASLGAAIIGLTDSPDRQMINYLQFGSSAFRVIFFLYLLFVVRETMH